MLNCEAFDLNGIPLIMECFITATGSYLPGEPVANGRISDFLGALDGEAGVAQGVLAMNGIIQRHYAQDEQQRPTEDVYDLACHAAQACLTEAMPTRPITFLGVGTTYAPLAGPGIASITHHRLQAVRLVEKDNATAVNAPAHFFAVPAGAMIYR